eukprot:scaffold11564_cov18-Tisochrysis_lutea.AAC.1
MQRGSDSGETTTSASSRSLLEKWRKTAGAPSSKDLRPSPYPSPSQGACALCAHRGWSQGPETTNYPKS